MATQGNFPLLPDALFIRLDRVGAMYTSQVVSSPTIVRCKQSRVVRLRIGVVTTNKETCLPSHTDSIEKAQISLGDIRMSCDRIYSKAPTLKTGWGFFYFKSLFMGRKKRPLGQSSGAATA